MSDEGPLRDGSVAIIKGELKVIDPLKNGRPATLIPGEGVKVYVNETEITGPTPVTTATAVRLELLEEQGSIEVKVEIAPDGLSANAHCEVTKNRSYVLKDTAPRRVLTLSTEVRESAPVLKVEEIEAALRKKGVFVGLNWGGIEELAADPTGMPRVVAEGTPPIPGKDAWIELKFQEMEGPKVRASLEESKVDWRELSYIPTVVEGDELAVKHPLVLGRPGLSVTGQPIEPLVPRDVELVAGQGAQVVDNGMRVVATQKGRPTAANGRIEVLPILVQERGVDLSTGNIRFTGDVLVKGNVSETMVVQAGGNIEVLGNAEHAMLIAGGEIAVRRNLIGGLVRAGGAGVVHLRNEDLWKQLIQGLEECAAAINQIASHPELGPVAARQGWGRVLHQLLDTKFRVIPESIRELSQAYNGVEGILVDEVQQVLTELRKRLTGNGPLGLIGSGELKALVKRAQNLSEDIKKQCSSSMSFVASYVHAAKVEAGEDIIISGQGSYQAHLYAGRAVRVHGKPGVVRGGIVEARERISVNEVGSASGAITLLKVAAGGVIEAGKVFPNVTLQVGAVRHLCDTIQHGVVARLNDRHELVLG
ncbi:MAG: DUF342 domain-containing protein [bacterium]